MEEGIEVAVREVVEETDVEVLGGQAVQEVAQGGRPGGTII